MWKIAILLTILLCSTAAIFAQTIIKGKITDAKDGSPVGGATIKVKGENSSTISKPDGTFELTSKAGKALEITEIGHVSQTVKLSGSGDLDIRLEQDAKALSEVVVTALGFQVKKDRVNTSQSTVKGQALVKSGETSVLTALASKASGVQVTRSGGDPGSGAYVQIRGQSTITGNIQPLIVIDGVPALNSNSDQALNTVSGVNQQSRLNDINPSDIASMEVLKSTAAAALWGTAAANGAIIITTKRGKPSGKVNISYSSTFSFDQINKSVPLQTAFGQGNSGLFKFNNRASWGDKISDRLGGADIFQTSGDYIILPDGSRRYRVASGTTTNPHGGKQSKSTFDHSKDLFRTGVYYDNNLSFSGGDEKSTFYASIANLTQKGILKAGSDYNRWSFRFNGDRKFGDNVKLSTGINYSNVASNRVQQGSNLNGIFLGGLRTSPDFDNTFYEGTYVNAAGIQFPKRQIAYRNSIGSATNSVYDNPFWVINKINDNSKVDRFGANFELSVKVAKDLQFIERVGIDYYNDAVTTFFPTIASGNNNGGTYTNQTTSERLFNNQVLLKYSRVLSNKLNLDVLAGHNYNSNNYSNVGATIRNFILPDAPPNFANAPSTSKTPFNSFSRLKKAGFLGQVDLVWDNMVFLQLTGRNEQASSYSGQFFFPSTSLGWVFTKLGAFQDNKVLSFGKIRGSWGRIGVEPGSYLTQTYFTPTVSLEGWGPQLDASSVTYGGGGYGRSFLKGNPSIKPEIKQEAEIGADFRFLSNKISLSFTYYQNKTKDAVLNTQVASSTGYDSKWTNAGEIENKGYELDLGVDWLKGKDFSVSSNFIWSQNRNKVISLAGVQSVFLNGFTGSDSRAVVGYPLGVLWGEDWSRNDKGEILLDANGFPQGKSASSMVIGNPNPDWTGAINTTVKWKNLSLGFLIDRVQGGDVWNGTKGALYTFGTHFDMGHEAVAPQDLKTVLGAIIPAGKTFRGYVQNWGAGPVALEEAWFGANRSQDVGLGNGFNGPAKQFIEDGSRTRLREVSLSYVVNGEKFKRKTKLQSIEISATGRNLWLKTNYSGIDPETNLTGNTNGRGLDYFNNPSTRSYLFTIRINY